eukprot:5311836-Amphidinium_carterae.1
MEYNSRIVKTKLATSLTLVWEPDKTTTAQNEVETNPLVPTGTIMLNMKGVASPPNCHGFFSCLITATSSSPSPSCPAHFDCNLVAKSLHGACCARDHVWLKQTTSRDHPAKTAFRRHLLPRCTLGSVVFGSRLYYCDDDAELGWISRKAALSLDRSKRTREARLLALTENTSFVDAPQHAAKVLVSETKVVNQHQHSRSLVSTASVVACATGLACCSLHQDEQSNKQTTTVLSNIRKGGINIISFADTVLQFLS